MLSNLRQVFTQYCLLDFTRIVLVGVSGGADSLCLLDGLHQAGLPLVVAHFHHGLRPEADRDAEAVGRAAAERGVPFVMGRAPVAEYARARVLSLEEAARILRYQFLFEQALACQAQAVAVGHTADDQVETVLMHLLRGAGSRGLQGMRYRTLPNPWSQSIPVARPLLDVWRSEILAYCQERGLQPVEDASNQDVTFFRNRLRHELLPMLQNYHPHIKVQLLRTAEILREEALVLDEVLEAAWQEVDVEAGEGFVAFRRQAFRSKPVAIRRSLIRRAIMQLRPGLRNIGFGDVQRALDFVDQPSRSGQMDLAGGLRLLREGNLCWLAAWEAHLPTAGWPQCEISGEAVEFPCPGRLALLEGWELTAEILAATGETLAEAGENADPYQAWLDADGLVPPFRVRARQPGDRFQPLGLAAGSQKLSDYMINQRLPRRARAGWPLVWSGDLLAWLPGYQIGHAFRLTSVTRRVCHLRLARPAR